LILEVSTGSANAAWRKKDKSDVKVISAQRLSSPQGIEALCSELWMDSND
jgi:hypothetical protein